MHIHRTVGDILLIAPEVIENLLTGKHPADPRCQEMEDAELRLCELQEPPVHENLQRIGVDEEAVGNLQA